MIFNLFESQFTKSVHNMSLYKAKKHYLYKIIDNKFSLIKINNYVDLWQLYLYLQLYNNVKGSLF